MKKRKPMIIVTLILVFALLAGGAVAIIPQFMEESDKGSSEKEAVAKTESGVPYFSEFTGNEIFAEVPAMSIPGTKIGTAEEYGNKSYILDVNGTELEDYKNYLAVLEADGFMKYSDNGEDGMEGYVYTTSFTKDDLVVTVFHVVNHNKTYISATRNYLLSPHLVYDAKSIEGVSADAKTKVHMLELNDNGNSFVIELKNGHFIVEDGGITEDAPYLVDYLESLTPGDEKPVIEAWWITHAHGDHYGALRRIMNNPDMASRLIVDGFYFVEPSKAVNDTFTNDNPEQAIWYVTNAAKAFKSQTGQNAKLYRPQLGQKYYFCDMYIEIPMTLEQFMPDAYYSADFNDTSTWIMHVIEGQKFLHAGDAGVTSTKMVMNYYDEEYFELDMFSVLHHGINVFDYFTDYCTIKTLLYTNRTVGSLYSDTQYARLEENAHLQESAVESIAHGDGTVVLSFPYEIGSAKIMEPLDWKYTNGERQHKYWDVVGGREK